MTKFKDIIGNKEIKERLSTIINEFKNSNEPNKFRSVLFLGPIGKTFFSYALINELGYVTFKIKGNDFNPKIVLNHSKDENNIIIFIDDYYDYRVKMKLKEFVNSIKNNEELRTKNIFLIATYDDNECGDMAKHFEEDFKSCFDNIISLSNKWNHEYFEEIINYYIKNRHVDPSINIDDLEGIFLNNPLRNIFDVLNNSICFAISEYVSIKHIVKEYADIFVENRRGFDNDYNEVEFVYACLLTLGESLKEGSSLFVDPRVEYFNSSLQEFNKLIEYPALDYPDFAGIIDFLDGDLSNVENVYNEIINLKLDKLIEITNKIAINDECFKDVFEEETDMFYRDMHNMIIDDIFDNDEEKKKWLELTQEILKTNKEFFFKAYDELVKNRYLFKSDIKRIRSSVEIIPFKGNL